MNKLTKKKENKTLSSSFKLENNKNKNLFYTILKLEQQDGGTEQANVLVDVQL